MLRSHARRDKQGFGFAIHIRRVPYARRIDRILPRRKCQMDGVFSGNVLNQCDGPAPKGVKGYGVVKETKLEQVRKEVADAVAGLETA